MTAANEGRAVAIMGAETTSLPGKVDSMARSPQSPEPPPRDADPIGAPEQPATDYVDGVPTFDFVRDRIEGRYATALGTTELADESAPGRTLAQQQDDREAAAREKLEQIRRSLRDG